MDRPLEPPPLLVELAAAEHPPVDLTLYVKRLRAAGVVEVKVVTAASAVTPVPIEPSAERARAEPCVIQARGRRGFLTSTDLDWSLSKPVAHALTSLIDHSRRFDKLTRFRLAASDMELAADAAAALVEVHERDGPARAWDRVIETGMVVTFVRPYLESNEAGLGRKWWPDEGPDGELFDELVELRHEYHAHAAHTPRRRLEFLDFLEDSTGRVHVTESWEQLPVPKLSAIKDLANRQRIRFEEEADRIDDELFGPERPA